MTTELGCDLGERMERAICQLHAPEMPPDLPTRVAQSASRRRMVRGVAMLALPALLLVGVVGIAYRPSTDSSVGSFADEPTSAEVDPSVQLPGSGFSVGDSFAGLPVPVVQYVADRGGVIGVPVLASSSFVLDRVGVVCAHADGSPGDFDYGRATECGFVFRFLRSTEAGQDMLELCLRPQGSAGSGPCQTNAQYEALTRPVAGTPVEAVAYDLTSGVASDEVSVVGISADLGVGPNVKTDFRDLTNLY
jgi:hypothetical protein